MFIDDVKRIEELKHREELLFNIVDRLQCYFGDNERLIEYLKQVGFSEEDIKKIVLLED